MSAPGPVIPDAVQKKALATGAAGRDWLEGLPRILAGLAAKWMFTAGPVLSGGSEALVLAVTQADGAPAVLKIGMPGADVSGGERAVLQAAAGHGYARLLAHDVAHDALLLERLGPSLRTFALPFDQEVAILGAALRSAWQVPVPAGAARAGAEKAQRLGVIISDGQARHRNPISARLREQLQTYVVRRRAAAAVAPVVLAHGDPHAGNLLSAPGSATGWKFVDPDGLVMEAAYDAGIVLREGPRAAQHDVFDAAMAQCCEIAAATELSPQPIWEWSCLERVSTAMVLFNAGISGGDAMLAVAEAVAVRGFDPAW